VIVRLFDEQGVLDLGGLEHVVNEQSIQVLVLNVPANPTGDNLDDDELARLAELARRRNLIVVADEVYNWVRYNGSPRSLLAFAPERTIVVGAASKEYRIPGARTGYILSVDPELACTWLPRMIRSTSSSPNVLGQHRALEMLAGGVDDLGNGRPPRLLLRIRDELERRRDRMATALQRTGWTILTRT
jgi:N-succinyldiaminopimelate aminotransferase